MTLCLGHRNRRFESCIFDFVKNTTTLSGIMTKTKSTQATIKATNVSIGGKEYGNMEFEKIVVSELVDASAGSPKEVWMPNEKQETFFEIVGINDATKNGSIFSYVDTKDGMLYNFVVDVNRNDWGFLYLQANGGSF